MRGPTNEFIQGGQKQLFLVEGEDVIGFKEHAGLSKDGVHPSAQGYRIIATKLDFPVGAHRWRAGRCARRPGQQV